MGVCNNSLSVSVDTVKSIVVCGLTSSTRYHVTGNCDGNHVTLDSPTLAASPGIRMRIRILIAPVQVYKDMCLVMHSKNTD